MLILTIRTDKPQAEIGLYQDDKKLAYYTWEAHRKLAETIHLKIKVLLEKQGLSLSQIEGIAVFKGPGSFTGLRIGLSVANALANGLSIPVVAKTGEDWTRQAVVNLKTGKNDHQAIPEYGARPHITQPRK